MKQGEAVVQEVDHRPLCGYRRRRRRNYRPGCAGHRLRRTHRRRPRPQGVGRRGRRRHRHHRHSDEHGPECFLSADRPERHRRAAPRGAADRSVARVRRTREQGLLHRQPDVGRGAGGRQQHRARRERLQPRTAQAHHSGRLRRRRRVLRQGCPGCCSVLQLPGRLLPGRLRKPGPGAGSRQRHHQHGRRQRRHRRSAEERRRQQHAVRHPALPRGPAGTHSGGGCSGRHPAGHSVADTLAAAARTACSADAVTD